jgi:hypothetical protein
VPGKSIHMAIAIKDMRKRADRAAKEAPFMYIFRESESLGSESLRAARNQDREAVLREHIRDNRGMLVVEDLTMG